MKIKKPTKSRPIAKPLVVAGWDMGSKNTAASVIHVYSKGSVISRIERISSEMITPLINDLTQKNYWTSHLQFAKAFLTWLKKYKPDVVMAERFISRGLRGSIGEKVTMMLGIMAEICRRKKIQFILVSAQSWKNTFCRRHFSKDKLEAMYLAVRKKNAHLVDSFLIAVFAAGGFPFLNEKRIDKLMENMRP